VTIQTTTRFGLPYPQRADTADVPRDVKALADRLELMLNQLIPIGALHLWTTAAAPGGWAMCDGSQQDRLGTYAALFAAIGTTFDTGSVPGTKFCLPDFRGRVAMGVDGAAARVTGNDALGNSSGVEKFVLGLDQIPRHGHTYGNNDELVDAGYAPILKESNTTGYRTQEYTGTLDNVGVNTIPLWVNPGASALVSATHTGAVTGAESGINRSNPASTDISSMQPYQVVNFIIRYQ
jgi:microcystin-dependent protein